MLQAASMMNRCCVGQGRFMKTKFHWEQVYTTKSAQAMSWYQPHATLSLEMIRRVATDKSARIVDVGGGASSLVDDLLADGMTNVSVLDLSGAALDVARQRLGEQAKRVHWVEGDITTVGLANASIDVWHDRAVFHFLTDPVDRAAYVAQVRRAVRPRGPCDRGRFWTQRPASLQWPARGALRT